MAAQQIKAPRGTHDVLAADSYKWQYVEKKAAQAASCAGYKQVRFPTFEETGLFQRGVGDTTDIVQKEMYTFSDKGDRSLTLRPEGTASTVRLALEHGCLNDALPFKAYYLITAFRYEKPQAGRYREFNQFGMELFGAGDPSADAELISVADKFIRSLGIKGAELKINSIGCPVCRAKYSEALKSYFEAYKSELCDTCLNRLNRNPLRILDCKSPVCSAIAAEAPKITDYLCDDCTAHYEALQAKLTALGIPFEKDPGIVRGLDYYTKTVFEFIDRTSGLAILAGGRYDNLVEELGGKSTPAIGFASGLERLVAVMQDEGLSFGEEPKTDIYIANIGASAADKALSLASGLRDAGISAETDIMARSLKAQMKYADKIGARYTVVLGDDEVAAGKATLKNMENGEKTDVLLTADEISRIISR
ncbi:MAG: histidine--tRNA ligase [Eubacteriales bacterium]